MANRAFGENSDIRGTAANVYQADP